MASNNQNAAAQEPSKSFWVFQYIPDEDNREVEAGGPGAVVPWRLTQFKEAVHPGDTVFVWRAGGPTSALIGWGEVTGEPFLDSTENITRINVTTRQLLPGPITKGEIGGHLELRNIGVSQSGVAPTFGLLLSRRRH
jgi:hypothetical protein